MTNEEIQKLMEFIVTQQAEITVKQSQILDIQFETAKRQAEYEKRQEEFEIKFNNKLGALLDWQAHFDTKLEELTANVKDLTDGLRSVSKRVDKLEDDRKKE
ncbi:MAG: hypothetical protein HY819_07690 [Acidobacteria bacterium]|nr:hypothetical protein [Acidobacteriota bacterium]